MSIESEFPNQNSHLDDDGSQTALQLLDDNAEGVEVLVKLLGVSVHDIVLDALSEGGIEGHVEV